MPGAPRKVDHRTGSNAMFAAAIADRLPGSSVYTRRGVATYKVDGHAFLTIDAADNTATVHTDEAEVDLALGVAGRDEVRAYIESAWADRAPKKSVTAYRAARTRWR